MLQGSYYSIEFGGIDVVVLFGFIKGAREIGNWVSFACFVLLH